MLKRKFLSIALFTCAFLLLSGFEAENLVQAKNQLSQASDELIEITPENLENFLDEFIPEEMDTAHVPGLVITVVQSDVVLLAKGYGYADLANQIPMTPQTNIRAGSVSKPVTASAVLQLVAQGMVDLEAPASDYIKDLDLNDEYGEASTIAQLLNHMSGYEDAVVLSHAPTIDEWQPLGEVLASDLPPRAFAPGQVMSYSSWDYALLGYILEQATGQPYEQAINAHLLAHLGMEHTTYLQPLPEEILSKLAVGYGWNYRTQSYDVVPHDFVRMSPGVALVTTAEDMTNYMVALLNEGVLDGKQALDPAAVKLILEPLHPISQYSRGRSYAFAELNLSGRKALYHDGNGIGFMTRILLMPDQDLGIFISINHRNLEQGLALSEAAAMARNLSSEIVTNFVPESQTEIPEVQPSEGSGSNLDQYAGHYQIANLSRRDFFKVAGVLDNVNVKNNGDGTLGIGSGTYIEVEPLIFQSESSPDFFVVFVENEESEVEFLTFGGTGSYQKVAWYQTVNFQIAVVSISALMFLSMAIIWPFARHGHWMVVVVSLLNLAFLVGMSLIFVREVTDLLLFYKTIPLWIQVLFGLPWLNFVLSFILLVFVVAMWRNGNATLTVRLHYSFVTAGSFVMFWLANFWNLILR